MGISIAMTKAFFDSKGLHYIESDDGKALSIRMGGLKNKDLIEVLVVFDDDDNSVAIRSYDVCKVPEDKLSAMYRTCSKLNEEVRWVKFYVGQENSVAAEDDAVIQPDSCGEEIMELVIRMISIIDGAYPQLMKTIWA